MLTQLFSSTGSNWWVSDSSVQHCICFHILNYNTHPYTQTWTNYYSTSCLYPWQPSSSLSFSHIKANLPWIEAQSNIKTRVVFRGVTITTWMECWGARDTHISTLDCSHTQFPGKQLFWGWTGCEGGTQWGRSLAGHLADSQLACLKVPPCPRGSFWSLTLAARHQAHSNVC